MADWNTALAEHEAEIVGDAVSLCELGGLHKCRRGPTGAIPTMCGCAPGHCADFPNARELIERAANLVWRTCDGGSFVAGMLLGEAVTTLQQAVALAMREPGMPVFEDATAWLIRVGTCAEHYPHGITDLDKLSSDMHRACVEMRGARA